MCDHNIVHVCPHHVSPSVTTTVIHVPFLCIRPDINMLLHSIRACVNLAGSSLFQQLKGPGGSFIILGSLVRFLRGRFSEGLKVPMFKKQIAWHPDWYCLGAEREEHTNWNLIPSVGSTSLRVRHLLIPGDAFSDILKSPCEKSPLGRFHCVCKFFPKNKCY